MNLIGHSTQDFLEQVATHPDAPLIFNLESSPLVGAGYHVTEVKAVLIEAMDCGGQADTWRETVVQLSDGSTEESARGFMTVQKFLSIYGKAAAAVPVRGASELRFEYGNSERPAIQYFISGVTLESAGLTVNLTAPGVTCKANDRADADASSCGCGPSGCGPAPAAINSSTGLTLELIS